MTKISCLIRVSLNMLSQRMVLRLISMIQLTKNYRTILEYGQDSNSLLQTIHKILISKLKRPLQQQKNSKKNDFCFLLFYFLIILEKQKKCNKVIFSKSTKINKNLYKQFALIKNNKRNMDIILMGDTKAGRSSIAKVIFQKMVSKQTMLLGQTSKMETYDFKIQKIQFKLYDFPAKYDTNDPPPNEAMILNNASALIFVLNPQSDTFKALDDFLDIHNYLKKKNKNNCPIFIFINKADIDLTQQDSRNQYQIKLKKKMNDDGIDLKQIDFFFTSIFDYSIFQAFSKVIQKMISCSPSICKILNKIANRCHLQKIYLFDLITKLYIAHNDQKSIDPVRYEICSEMLDIFIDISFLYGGDKKHEEAESNAQVKMELEEENQLFLLKSMETYLAIVVIVKQSNYDRPYLIDQNLDVFKKSLVELLNITNSTLK